MHVIRPICRIQFTAEDIDFIVSVLTPNSDATACLVELLGDPDSRDVILDDVKLFRAVLENVGCVRFSSRLYFYVMVRHVMLEAGIDDPEAADYIAELLSVFISERRRRNPLNQGDPPLHYVVDMLAALQTATSQEQFVLRAHLGNFTLFLAGLFPAYVRRRRERRAAPSLDYYESIGRESFRVAGNHHLADEFELGSVFDTLAERFRETRVALNDLSDRLVYLQEDRFAGALLIGNS
jgi:hypothetical protein